MALSTAHYAYYYFSLFRAEMVVNGRWYPWCSSLAYSFITLYFLTKKSTCTQRKKKINLIGPEADLPVGPLHPFLDPPLD